MAYATSAEFAIHGLPGVALDGFSGDPNDYLATASGDVDSYLRGRYTLPLAEPYPPEIVRATCVLAAYALLSIRGFDPEDGRNQNVRMRYDDTMAWLDKVSEGRVNLSLDSDSTPTEHDGRPRVRSKARDTSWRFR